MGLPSRSLYFEINDVRDVRSIDLSNGFRRITFQTLLLIPDKMASLSYKKANDETWTEEDSGANSRLKVIYFRLSLSNRMNIFEQR